MMTVAAFLLALTLLIAVHEYGHYRMAVACRVKVLRFSIGFGKVLLRWQSKGSPTEFVLCAVPLGGYVRMLDEREGPVAPEEKHLAFNRQSLGARAAVVFAGPMANLVLAVLLYAAVSWMGTTEPAAILSSPAPNSIAARAGLSGKERVLSIRVADGEAMEISSMEALRWQLLRSALSRDLLGIEFTRDDSSRVESATLDMTALDVREVDAALMLKVGVMGPHTEPLLGEILVGGAAERAGLLAQDRVIEVDGVAMVDGAQLRETIRAYALQGQGKPQRWRVERAGKPINLEVIPDLVKAGDSSVGRVGAAVGSVPQMLLVQRGLFDGLSHGLERTVEVSAMTLRMMGRMLIGQASLRNLSGPLTIADYAGKSASFGLVPYLLFLALISVSLGVLNLLPLPVLDGGHLMYYLWEWLTGKTISDAWLERLQRGGVALLFLMMSLALYNDVTRLLWG